MHDIITDTRSTGGSSLGTVQKANECRSEGPVEPLFDAFWGVGEMAVLFGPPGAGKSVLAVQIAESLARGRPIDGFDMPKRRQRVLLVDMKLSNEQFRRRYSVTRPHGTVKAYRESENLMRGRPHEPENLCEWLRATVIEERISVVMIDDVSELRTTYDGTRELLKTVRELKRMQRELNFSLLLIASSREPGKTGIISESELLRSRVLCDAADSAFSIAIDPRDASLHYLLQTRSVAGRLKWTADNTPNCRLRRDASGFLGFAFDERFLPKYDEQTRQQIVYIKHMHDEGASYRFIADDMGLPLSRIYRLHKLWRTDLESENDDWGEAEDDWDAEEDESEPPAVAGGLTSGDASVDEGSTVSPFDNHPETVDAFAQPPAIAGGTDSYDYRSTLIRDWPEWALKPGLEREITDHGEEILVEKRDERGKRKVWYRLTSNGRVRRWVHDGFGGSGSAAEPPAAAD